ncbi:MAG: DUF4143 domain-containing protein [Prochlorococcaceae cyanobacterium]
MGLLFESLVVRDLRVLSQALDGEVFHYRDNDGREVDAIVQLRDGRWGATEIKLGPGQVEAAELVSPPSWRWSAAVATATSVPMAWPWCRWGHWGPELLLPNLSPWPMQTSAGASGSTISSGPSRCWSVVWTWRGNGP